jgi:hypothetical protein
VPRIQLTDLSGPPRLAVGCFAALVLGFALLAQVNLWYQVSGGKPPTPLQVLERYHGNPDRTRLHEVLDPALPPGARRNMSRYLGGVTLDDPVTTQRRKQILDWVDAGAPESGWAQVEPIFTSIESCGACHAVGGERQDLPLSTWAEAVVVAQPGEGYPLGPLLISAHTHLFGFAVLALLLSLGLCATRVRGRLRTALLVGAPLGAALDVASWFLTRAFGAPFHWAILAGGALFGFSTTLMALLVLRDVVTGPGRSGPAGEDA